ncbi:MAG TPA: DUF1573 domain-containing protein [Pirellulaceae bacterium]|jgi:hypothetical protein|nr:DUF1573 domain-containing protein [Pirellulaceae bacterium]
MSRKNFPLFAVACLAVAAAAVSGIFFVVNPATAETATVAVRKPRVEVPEQIHRFGTMNPYEERRHTFVIYNRGDAPLELRTGATSCKCTFSELPENVVPPQGVGRVTLEWKTQKVKDLFANTAEILTNDPQNPAVLFRIEGQVRHEVQASPDGLTFASLSPGEEGKGSFLVFSQTFDKFRLENVSVTLPGATWSTREASPADLASHSAKGGLHVDLTLPTDMKSGPFSGSVVFDAVPESGESVGHHYEVRFAGNVTRCVCVYGLEFTLNGGMDLGTFVQGQRREWNGLIKLRGERQTIEVQSIETLPSDLQVTVEPFLSEGTPKPGMYRFKIVLPETAAVGTFNKSTEVGKIVVRTDHPLDPVLEIPVSIAVLSAQVE